jgi:glyoxylase-like metal-dependent hydrolase (beta-lactamase superfamily II)
VWKIYPLDVGDLEQDKSEAVFRRRMGERGQGRFIAWYLTDGASHVVVDTGPPDEISLVILTHLHWDHAGNMPLFRNADFVVSHDELVYAIDPCPIHYVAYEAAQLGLTPPFLPVMGRMRTISMSEQEIVPGLVALPTPGHTPGSISLVVTTTAGPYVITGDAVCCYENLEGDPAKKLKYLPTGLYTDLLAMWNSMALIDAKALYRRDHVLPAHDSRVFQHRSYPSAE